LSSFFFSILEGVCRHSWARFCVFSVISLTVPLPPAPVSSPPSLPRVASRSCRRPGGARGRLRPDQRRPVRRRGADRGGGARRWGGPCRGWSTRRLTPSTWRTSSCGTCRRGRMGSARPPRPRSASTDAASSRRAASSSGCILLHTVPLANPASALCPNPLVRAFGVSSRILGFLGFGN